MYNFIALLKKEFKGFIKEYKLIWVPIVFIGVCILQPITMNLLPSIIGEEEGFIIDSSIVYTGDSIFSGVYSQLNQIGIIIVAILMMGSVSAERKEGILDVILSKKVSSLSYLLSKYVAYVVLILASLMIGSIVALYYSEVLFPEVTIDLYIKSMLSYSLWFLFVLTLGLMFSTISKSQIQAALGTALTAIAFIILPSVVSEDLIMFLPSSMSINATSIMNGEGFIENYQIATFIVAFQIIILFGISTAHMYKQYKK